MRKQALITAGLVLPAIGLSGCLSSGLSMRETGRQNYSGYVYSLYDDDTQVAANAQPATLSLPARVAVAQIGEVSPPATLIDTLRNDPAVFARVEGIPGIAGEPDPRAYGSQGRSDFSLRDQARSQMNRMRQVARDMQMDYLLVCGGTIDHATTDTGLSLLDLTIVGAFVVPSKEIQGTARASAAMVDVETGRVVLITSAEADRTKLASSVGQQGGQIDLLERLRDDVVDKLGKQVVTDCRQRANGQGAGQAAVSLTP